VLRQAQIADHFRVQQAHGVARRRVAETGVEFLGDGGASQDGPAFEYGHFQAFFREVAGAGEAVVAAADDDRIEAAWGA
jgi:hypothetical protein